MGKGGLLKTLRAYKSTLLIFALLLIIAFSIFNTQKRKIIENLPQGKTESSGNKGTTESSGNKGKTESSGNKGTTESSGNKGTTGQPLTPAIKTNNKYLEVFLWYDPLNIAGKQGERIYLYELLKNNFCTVNNPYVLFQTYHVKDYIEHYFITEPKFKDFKTDFLRDNGNSLTAWTEYKKNFSEANAPIITFCVVDRNANPHKRECLGGYWLSFDTTLKNLEFMLTAFIYSHQIGVAIDTPSLSSVTSESR